MELQYIKVFDQNVCISGIFAILIFTIKNSLAKIVKIYFSTRNLYIWANINLYIVVE